MILVLFLFILIFRIRFQADRAESITSKVVVAYLAIGRKINRVLVVFSGRGNSMLISVLQSVLLFDFLSCAADTYCAERAPPSSFRYIVHLGITAVKES
jgi:hypothetical protein